MMPIPVPMTLQNLIDQLIAIPEELRQYQIVLSSRNDYLGVIDRVTVDEARHRFASDGSVCPNPNDVQPEEVLVALDPPIVFLSVFGR
jgi:hypothetical protein